MTDFFLRSHVFLLVIAFVLAMIGVVKYKPHKIAVLTFTATGIAIAIVSIIVYDLSNGSHYFRQCSDFLQDFGFYDYFWVGLIGLAVGAIELVARYRDNPQRAIMTPPALLYMAINLAACVSILYIINSVRPAWLFAQAGSEQQASISPKDHLYIILVAGFGAVALFRSSIFKVKTNDGDLSVGPAIILDTILNASDRAVDRSLAGPRGIIIAQIMKDVSFQRAKSTLPVYCFALMQNVSEQEQKEVGKQVNDLSAAAMDDEVRSLNLGLVLINVVGAQVLKSAVENLGVLIKGEPPIEEREVAKIADLVRSVDFDRASIALPTYCFSLIPTVSADSQSSFISQIGALKAAQLPPRVKTLVLGLAISNLVGYAVLKLAVQQLGDDIG